MNNGEPAIGTRLTLSRGELELAGFVAGRRQESNESAGFTSRRISRSMTDLEVNLIGVIGEMAFCRLFNCYWNGNGEPRLRSEDDGDCTIHGYGHSYRCDVKTTGYDTGPLSLFPGKGTPRVEVYALMTGKSPTLTYRGLMWSNRLLSCPLVTVKYASQHVHVAEQFELKTLRDCIDEVR